MGPMAAGTGTASYDWPRHVCEIKSIQALARLFGNSSNLPPPLSHSYLLLCGSTYQKLCALSTLSNFSTKEKGKIPFAKLANVKKKGVNRLSLKTHTPRRIVELQSAHINCCGTQRSPRVLPRERERLTKFNIRASSSNNPQFNSKVQLCG